MFLTKLPLSEFFGLKSKTNILLFITLALVSLFDLIALYFFTEVVTSQITGFHTVFLIITFFLVNMIIQVYSIRILPSLRTILLVIILRVILKRVDVIGISQERG